MENGRKTNINKEVIETRYNIRSKNLILILSRVVVKANKRVIIIGNDDQIYKFDKMRGSDAVL